MKGPQGPTLSHNVVVKDASSTAYRYLCLLRTHGFIMFKRTRYLTIS